MGLTAAEVKVRPLSPPGTTSEHSQATTSEGNRLLESFQLKGQVVSGEGYFDVVIAKSVLFSEAQVRGTKNTDDNLVYNALRILDDPTSSGDLEDLDASTCIVSR